MEKSSRVATGAVALIVGAAGLFLAVDLQHARALDGAAPVGVQADEDTPPSPKPVVKTHENHSAPAQLRDDSAPGIGTREYAERKVGLISPEALEHDRADAVAAAANCSGDGGSLSYPFADDGTWVLAMGPNDDNSAFLSLPFTFPLYGTGYANCWINNNGNISFDGPYGNFSAFAFPTTSFVMVAPFWADVDTRNRDVGTGLVWLKMVDGDADGTFETMVVTWDNVGYYSGNTDKLNTFQVAISDGTNPGMGVGNTVCFSYDNMCWTTGSASGGAGGFGGVPATVGANRGNGADFFQLGRFDHPGTDYDGPFGAPDGVDWLDAQRICVNTASMTNIPPIPQGFPAGNAVDVDPGLGTPLDLMLRFLSPEVGQTTAVTVSDVGNAQVAGLAVVNTPGNVADVHLTWLPACTDVGSFVLDFSATDDAAPPGVTNASLTINVGPDCNGNGAADGCDILDGTSADCTGNGIPDECEPDCNGNGAADSCDIADGTSLECNGNGIPDECDISDGTSPDCNGNGIPDECEQDCNANGVADDCDITAGTSGDCQPNGIPDECELVPAHPVSQVAYEFDRVGLDWSDSDDDDSSGTVALPFSVEIEGETYTQFLMNSNGYVELLRAGEFPYDPGYGCVSDITNSGIPGHTFLMGAYDDLSSYYSGQYGYRLEADRAIFYWYTETYCDDDSGELSEFEIILYIDGRVQWSFADANYSCWDCDLFSGLYLGYGRAELFEIYRDFIPDLESWQFLLAAPNDCNDNQVLDECDIADGTSRDCNSNNLPDECEGDCNANGIADECDVADGTSQDCNGNSVPDECELTPRVALVATSGHNGSNRDSFFLVDPATGVATLIGLVGTGAGALVDVAVDPTTGIIYAAETVDDPQFIYTIDPSSGAGTRLPVPTGGEFLSIAFDAAGVLYGAGWYDQSLFILDKTIGAVIENRLGAPPFPGDITGLAMAADGTLFATNGDYPPGQQLYVIDATNGNLLNALPITDPTFLFRKVTDIAFGADGTLYGVAKSAGGEGGGVAGVGGGGSPFSDLVILDPATGMITSTVGSTGFALSGLGAPVALSFGDCNGNGAIDECDILAGVSLDCNGNSVPDECEVDCNGNGIPDECEIVGGSTDCNGNGVPDECEPDCNGNGIADACDISSGISTDCDGNGVPDSCDVASGTGADCNGNGTLDECEQECNGNNVPDECDIADGTSLDCNGNGAPDECEEECNGNGIPDDCDIASGSSQDCNGNGLPDECDGDCNGNGNADECDIADGTSLDCNGNSVPDECEIASGAAQDCQTNGALDSCEIDLGTSEDCNANSIPDECDIASGSSEDCQSNAIPDDCEWEALLAQSPLAGAAGRGAFAAQSTASLCQLPDQQMHGGAFIVPVNSDPETGAADSFNFAQAITATNVTWWGTYRDECGEPCGAADDFVLTFYVNDGGPANVAVATYNVGAAVRFATGQIIPLGPGFTEYQYSFDLVPPLSVGAGQRHWVDIRNAAGGSCTWQWETAPEGASGNGTSLYDAGGDGYEDSDLAPYDLALCVSGLPASEDCNANGIHDAQDILDGTSQDCQPNGVPDECEDDDNFNGVADSCDIVSGSSRDLNFNGVPDEAECFTTPGDLDNDCDVDRDDLALFIACRGKSGVEILSGCNCADLDGNDVVDMVDYLLFSMRAGKTDVACRTVLENACPDSWSTGTAGGGSLSRAAAEATFYDFGTHGPIPAGFFGPGSDPFGEIVNFIGVPADPNGVSGDVDTQIQHGPVVFDPVTGEATTGLEIVTLQLISEQPIIVSFGGAGSEEWLVIVGLSPNDPGSGVLTATLGDPAGNSGTYDATVFVQPAFLFIKLQDLVDHVLPECVDSRVLDTGATSSPLVTGAEPIDGVSARRGTGRDSKPRSSRSWSGRHDSRGTAARDSRVAAATAMPPITLSFVDQSFVRTTDPAILDLLNVADCAQGNFVPGVFEPAPISSGGTGFRAAAAGQQLTCTSHITQGESHFFCPPECDGNDVCRYTKSGSPTPIACATLPAFPAQTLGMDCLGGFCSPFTAKLKACPGGGFAFQIYGSPACISRETTCKGACCSGQGACVLSTAALCDGDYQGDGSGCSPNPCACELDITDTPAAWMPQGRAFGTATGAPGNSVTYTATVTNGGPSKIRFFLEGVSTEPGVCINYGDESTTAKDLKFIQSGGANPAGTFDAPSADGMTITTTNPVNSATVTVTSYDWGGWGKIKACCLDENGVCQNTTSLKGIPVDDLPAGGNHVADAWQSANSGKAATWDDDAAPANMKRNGDGYSFYEEYRGAMKGFIVSHSRLDPAEKDLFIYDEDLLHLNGHSGHKFIFLTLMNIHYVNGDPAKLMNGGGTAAGGHRWINRKSAFGKIANQYALHIKKFDLGGRGSWGLVDGPSLGPPKTADPLVKVDDAQVATDLSAAVTAQGGNPATTEKAAFENVRDRQITTTMTHEMGHGCALPHHSCANGGRNGGYGNQHCGDITCVMRYDFDLVDKADAAHLAMYGARTAVLSPPATLPVRFRFSNYTDKDLSDLTPVLNTFCTTNDNSRGKMDVKDNP